MGTREDAEFDRLKRLLDSFEDLPIVTSDYEQAARFYKLCRRKGVQGSNTDFLICACAVGRSMPIFTMDKDFVRFSEYLPIQLYSAADRT
jgi:predicted nucleic acid-binding protein